MYIPLVFIFSPQVKQQGQLPGTSKGQCLPQGLPETQQPFTSYTAVAINSVTQGEDRRTSQAAAKNSKRASPSSTWLAQNIVTLSPDVKGGSRIRP